MKSMKLLSVGLVSLCALALGTPMVLASEETPVANATGDVKFVKDTGTVDPEKPEIVDPTNPEEKEKPVIPGDEGSVGDGNKAFNINWVSKFKFGEIKIAGTTMTAYAQPTTLNWGEDNGSGEIVPTGKKAVGLANFLRVTDNTGENKGWDVKVKGTPFYELDGDNNQIVTDDTMLTGAAITLNSPQVTGAAGNEDLAPTEVSGALNILTGADVPVFKAAPGKGQGTWDATWGAVADSPILKGITVTGDTVAGTATASGVVTDGVKLTVPVTAQPKADKTYQATLVWTLAVTPQS